MSGRHPKDRLHGRWLPEGGFAKIRESLGKVRSYDASVPTDPNGFAAQFARQVEAAQHERVRAQDVAAGVKARRAKDNPLERTVLASVLRALRARGHVVHRMTSGVFRTGNRTVSTGEVGMPDLQVELGTVAAPCDRVLWLEVKRPGQGARDSQQTWMARAAARGQRCRVVHSAEEALAALDEALS
jgi:hypothetical protein